MPEKRRLRIMHVVLSRGFAGSERSTAESCNQQSLNHDVCIVIRSDHRKLGASIVDHLDQAVVISEVSPHIFTKWQLRRSIRQFSPDVIHCHLRRSTRLVAKIKSKAATVSTLHISVNGPHFMQMDGLVCNARWQVESIPESYTGRIHKASNSLVPHPRISREDMSSLRRELGVSDDQYLVAAVGRYHASKGWDTLIDAFKRTTNKDVVLLFFGSGGLESELKQMANGDSRIHFVGFREDIKDLYQCFDLMLCPSRFEPLPRVMLEGMDAGLPIIASDEGGCKELIEDYGGQIFPVDERDRLLEELNIAFKARLGKRYPDLSSHYIENANEAMIAFYRSL